MKNREIIAAAAVAAGMYTREEADRMLQEDIDIPLHTIQGWRGKGPYKVKQGEDGIETKLWKISGEKFYLAKAYLFRLEQMELVG